MSLVEKALRKLQASRPAPETPPIPVRHGNAAALHERAPKIPAAVVQPLPPIVEFDPRTRNSKIVAIDRDRLRSVNMLPSIAQEREIAGQFRAIKRPLMRQLLEFAGSESGTAHTVMVASALPSDGKTFTSLNLALSLALEMDFTVLLVDGDAPKPHLTHTFGLEREPGLLDVLADPKRNVEDVILATDVPGLHFLPTGTRSETAAELLASARMSEVVAQLGSLYRRGMVLFDSPPVLLTSESRTLAAMLHHVVLVVRAGVTPQQAVKDAVGILGAAAHVSLVLNDAQLDGPIGYYYGHQYGHELGAVAASVAVVDE